MLILNTNLVAAINRHAESSYPYECCGLLLGRMEGDEAHVVEAKPLTNQRADSPRNRYVINPLEQLRAIRNARTRGMDMVGAYHSHPDVPAKPSQYDQDHAWPGYVYVIVSVVDGRAGELAAWRLAQEGGQFERIEIQQVEAVHGV